MNRSNLIVAGVIAVIVGALVFRVWSKWPEELPGGRYLERIEKRGRDYALYPKPSVSLSEIASLYVLEGYTPSNHSEFQQRIETRPSKIVQERDDHRYIEYMGQYGRMQFHSSYHLEEGIAEWLEFLPTDLSIDAFLSADVAINLDLTQPEFKVYISFKPEHMYMTVFVKNRKIDRIVWVDL